VQPFLVDAALSSKWGPSADASYCFLCQNSALAGVPIGAGRDPVPSEFVETYQNVVALLGRVSLEHLITFGASIVNIIAKPENQRKT
jgi:hypothetical protein